MGPPRASTQLVPVIHIPNSRSPTQPLTKDVASITPAARDLIKHFSQSQLALALVIQKSRPESLTTAEYLQQLRKRVRTGRPVSSDDHRYVDSSEFWKDQYTAMRIEKKVLEDKIHRLEEAQRLLLDGNQDSGSLDHRVRQILRLSIGGSDGTTYSPKRPAPCREAPGSVEDGESLECLPVIKDSHLRLSRYVFGIAQHRTSLKKAMNTQEYADQIDFLSANCNQTISFLINAISDICTQLGLSTTADPDPQTLKLLQLAMNQVVFTFRACFEALNVLGRSILGRTKKAEIVHRMILFFKNSLDLLQSSAKLQANHEASQRNRRLRKTQTDPLDCEYTFNKYLSNAVASILQTVEWNASLPGHSDLLEGILYLILSHTGRLLSHAIFQEHVAEAEKPGNISSVTREPSEAGRLESRYILQILHAAIAGPSRKDIITQLVSTKGHAQVNGDSVPGSSVGESHRKSLLHKARLLIQSTLVKSTVGGVDLESLELPLPPEEMVKYPVETIATVEKYGPEWFVESVWGLIGWEMVV